MKKNINAIDLFAGAGGLSEGFLRNNINIITYVEKDKYVSQSLLKRHIYWYLKSKNKENIYYDHIKGNNRKEEYHKFFLEKNLNPVINKGVKTYLISDNFEDIPPVDDITERLEETGKLYIRSYSDLFKEAINYNNEFIKQCNEIKKLKINFPINISNFIITGGI